MSGAHRKEGQQAGDIDHIILSSANDEDRLAELLASFRKEHPEMEQAAALDRLKVALERMLQDGKIGIYESEIGRAYKSRSEYRDLPVEEAVTLIGRAGSWDWEATRDSKSVYHLFAKDRITAGSCTSIPPRFLSLEFHTRFFPRFIRDRFRSMRRQREGVSFPPVLEMFLTLAVSFVLALIGVPLALNQGSILGWILTVIGVGGIILLFIQSVGSQWGSRPTYDDFLAGIYFLLVSLGIIIGIVIGMDHHAPVAGVVISIGGFIAGHVIGIGASLQMQRLGWIAVIINMLAGFGAICVGGGTIIMLIMVAFG